ncbi:hypothetical protein BGZ96_011137 [Linnemannia gamsii]|uniref:Uncharacterized protein n=1 Tax=Linnemannia gamsii TaxID=64522 RepID=A0ABQ7JTH4_9FUNG|nr:hypothetical protein BGZ96_011137 [Linnemannia gamsii]
MSCNCSTGTPDDNSTTDSSAAKFIPLRIGLHCEEFIPLSPSIRSDLSWIFGSVIHCAIHTESQSAVNVLQDEIMGPRGDIGEEPDPCIQLGIFHVLVSIPINLELGIRMETTDYILQFGHAFDAEALDGEVEASNLMRVLINKLLEDYDIGV